MACYLLGTKPLSESMLSYHWLKHWTQISMKSVSKYNNFHTRKCGICEFGLLWMTQSKQTKLNQSTVTKPANSASLILIITPKPTLTLASRWRPWPSWKEEDLQYIVSNRHSSADQPINKYRLLAPRVVLMWSYSRVHIRICVDIHTCMHAYRHTYLLVWCWCSGTGKRI